MISVLIPSRTDEYLETLFASMERSESGSVGRCIVGDNGLSVDFKKRWPQATYVDVPKPFVFSKAINLCALPGLDTDLLILNDDTEVLTPYWLTMIEDFLTKKGPEFPFGMLSLQIEGGVGNTDQAAEIGVDEVVQTFKTVCFVAVVIPRRVWAKVGPLDERFIGYGMDDNDYSRRCVEAGFRLGITGAATIKHGGKKLKGTQGPQMFVPSEKGEDRFEVAHSSSYLRYFGSAEWQRQYELNVEIFRAKWGVKEEITIPSEKSKPEWRRCLNVGCGSKAIHVPNEEWVNVDVRPLPGVDVVRDLRRGLPFNDATFDHVLADNILEHFRDDDFSFILNEIDRVLKVGGTVEIIVPDSRSQASVQDPTHKMFFAPRSALYWNQVQTPHGGKAVGITANLLLTKPVEYFGDSQTEAFLRFSLRKEALK